MRRRLDETEAFEKEVGSQPAARQESMWRTIVRHRRSALLVIGMTVGVTIVYYAWAISAPQYAISTRGIDPTSALWAGVLANLVFIAALPVWGRISDRIGRKPVLLSCVLGLAVSAYPLNALIGDSAVRLGIAMSLALILIAGPAAIVPAVYAELFPTRIRTVGVGVPYSIAVATFGGTAPYLQTWLGETFGPSWFTGYVIVMLLISAIAIASAPETRGRDLTGMH
jgi:MHS family alpha-ketoglutarate permease-like MFS transporter